MLSDTLYEVRDERFRDLLVLNANLEELYSDCMWAEGPVWCEDWGHLIWSDIPNQRMLRWVPGRRGLGVPEPLQFFQRQHPRPSRTADHLRAWHASRDAHRARRRDHGPGRPVRGRAPQFAQRRGRASDGAIWFTDPTYGIISDYEGYTAEPEQDRRRVYRLDPDWRTDGSGR